MTNAKTIWKQVCYKSGVWLAAEIWLNLIGLDNIADYSEFVFAEDLGLNRKNHRTVKITEYPPQFCPQIDDFCPLPRAAIDPKKLKLKVNNCMAQAEVFKHKCQRLAEPCLKIMCLKINLEVKK
ncbi:hypothetical protein [Myxosarcina sp. GI1(2024)]